MNSLNSYIQPADRISTWTANTHLKLSSARNKQLISHCPRIPVLVLTQASQLSRWQLHSASCSGQKLQSHRACLHSFITYSWSTSRLCLLYILNILTIPLLLTTSPTLYHDSSHQPRLCGVSSLLANPLLLPFYHLPESTLHTAAE